MQWFVIPRLDGAISGGTLYNRLLIAGLKDSGCACDVLPFDQAMAVLAKARGKDGFWVDSLYPDRLPLLARATRPGTRSGPIVEYLPSLISNGEGIGAADLPPTVAAALPCAKMFLVPSPFLAGI